MAGMRSAMRSPMRSAISKAVNDPRMSLTNQALAILRKFGTNAHVYLPGSTQVSYGAELVTNGDFSQGTTGWITVGAEWSVSSSASVVGVGSYTNLDQNISIGASKPCLVSINVLSISGGALRVALGNSTFDTSITTTGVKTLQITTVNALGLLRIQAGSGVSATIDNISVREVITTSSVVSGLSTGNYTSNDGSTGYSAIDGTAGLVLDGAGSVGADLLNGIGAFDSATGWSITQPTSGSVSISGGTLTINSVDGSWAAATASGYPVVANSTYYYEIDATATGGQGVRVDIGGAAGVQFTGSGVFTGYIKAINTSAPLVARGGATANSGAVVRSLVIREVTGIHASQSTGANRPGVRRGLYNLLTYSNDLSNAAWTKGNSSVTSGVADPVGGSSAFALTESAITGDHSIQQSVSVVSGTTYTFAFIAKAGARSIVAVRENVEIGSNAYFDLNTGVASGAFSPNMVGIGGGWYLCTLVRAYGGATQSVVLFTTKIVISGTTTNYAGDGSSGVSLYRQGLFTGTLTASQILSEGGIPLTTSAAASNPSAGRYSWQFDGSNDSLALGSVPFQISDDHCVIAGAICNATNSINNIIAAPSQGATTAHRAASLAYDDSLGAVQAGWYDGTNYDNLTYSYPKDSPFVASARKVSTIEVLRINGTQRATKTATASGLVSTTGSIGAYTAEGGSSFYKGSIGPVIVIKGTVSDADLLTLERWVASQTPNGPVF